MTSGTPRLRGPARHIHLPGTVQAPPASERRERLIPRMADVPEASYASSSRRSRPAGRSRSSAARVAVARGILEQPGRRSASPTVETGRSTMVPITWACPQLATPARRTSRSVSGASLRGRRRIGGDRRAHQPPLR